jgi:ATP-dependent helicase/nuclease subunit A
MKWSETKKKVFEFDRNTVVSAGAGSGKTAALVELYLRLLSGETALGRPLEVGEIVAITFTEKAAAEMKERVRGGVRKRMEQGDRRVPWEKISRTLPSANISTFHSFCSKLLRENPVEAGIDPSFTVLDDMASKTDLAAAVDQVLESELKEKTDEIGLLLDLFPLSGMGRGQGLREHLSDLHRVLSGSGNVSSVIRRQTEEWNIAAQRQFADNTELLKCLLPEVQKILQGKELVFHRKLRNLPELFKLSDISLQNGGMFAILSSMQGCIAGNWGKEKPLRDRLSECLTKLDRAFSQVWSSPIINALLSLLEKLELAYLKIKEGKGVLDFEDLLLRTRDLLQRDRRLREEYRSAFAVIMVDEFQDTNQLQKELVSLLCGPDQRLFIVGDPKQSIYLFRGADVTVFVRSQQEVEGGGGHNLYFQESFRSREGIVSFVNSLFARVMGEGGKEFEVSYSDGDALQPERRDWDGNPCVELLVVNEMGDSAAKRNAEATALSGKILQIVSGETGTHVYDREYTRSETGEIESRYVPRRARYGDIAILFRRFTNLKLFERELRRMGIPYYVLKGKGFYRCQEVLDILNFLKYLEFAGDVAALAGILRSPLCAVSDETLYLLGCGEKRLTGWGPFFASQASPISPALWKQIDERDRGRLELLRSLISRLKPLKDRLTPAELLEEILFDTDFASSLLTTFQGSQKVANLHKLIELSRSFAQGENGTLRSFINYLTRLAEEEPNEAEAVISAEGEDVVRLMTIHQSKGLEFPIVFVPDIGAGSRPDNSPVKYDDSIGIGIKLPGHCGESHNTLAFEEIGNLRRNKEDAESQRLFYVALTRARDYLVLSGEGSGSWRSCINEFAAGDGASLITLTNADESLSKRAAQGVLSAGEGVGPCEATSTAEALRRSLHYTPPSPSLIVLSPSALEDFAECPRKYYYRNVVGLDDAIFSRFNRMGDRYNKSEPGMSALEKGNLAHAMLEVLDYSADRDSRLASCRRSAEIFAVDPHAPEIEDVMENVLAFADSPVAAELVGKKVWRELPFMLRVDGTSACYIKGAMDLVAEGADAVTVYDYKYMKKKDVDLHGYMFQIRTYMLALAAGHPGKRIAGKLIFLRGGGEASVDCDFLSFENYVRSIMDRVRLMGKEEDFIPKENCLDTRCPFRSRCTSKHKLGL